MFELQKIIELNGKISPKKELSILIIKIFLIVEIIIIKKIKIQNQDIINTTSITNIVTIWI